MGGISNPMLASVNKVEEVRDMKEAASMMMKNEWVMLMAIQDKDGSWIYCMGKPSMEKLAQVTHVNRGKSLVSTLVLPRQYRK